MASVIKAGQIQPGTLAARTTEFNLEDMSQTASEYLDSVKQRARQIVVQAQQQAQTIRTQAQQQGKQAAVEEAQRGALAALDAKWQTLAPALEKVIQSTDQLRNSWISQWEKNAIHLIIAVAQRVVRGELNRRPEITQQWIREALELASSGTQITLHLNPEDFENLGDKRADIAAQLGRMSSANIVPDPNITSGGCRVVTEHGQIDQQLQTQLARIEEELTA